MRYFTLTCLKKTSIFITCQLPAVISYFGYYIVNLYEKGTMFKLNDENVLSLIILPRPIIDSTQMDTYVTTQSETHLGQDTSSQVYITHFKVLFNDGFNNEYLHYYKQKYLENIICRVGSSLQWITANSTWHSEDQIMCTLRNFYNWQPECVEVSINGGRSYTSDCNSVLASIRAPVAYGYSPTQTMLRQPLTITIEGKDFI